MRFTIKNRQSLIDKVIEECGSIEHILRVSNRNELSITDYVIAGTAIDIETTDVSKPNIVARLKAYGVIPATELSQADIELVPYGGIGFMGVEIDFIVGNNGTKD